MKESVLNSSIGLIAYHISIINQSNSQEKNWFDAIKVIESVVIDSATLGSIDDFITNNQHLKMQYSDMTNLFHNSEIRKVLFLFFIGSYEYNAVKTIPKRKGWWTKK